MYYTNRALILGILFFITALIAIFAGRFVNAPIDNKSPGKPEKLNDATANLATGVSYYNHLAPFPEITAESFLIADINTREIWKKQRENSTHAIASLTKLMTSLLFAELLPQEEWYRISREAKNTIPKISNVPEGSFVLGSDIIRLMLMESDNDAAQVAAEKIGRMINFEKRSELDFNSALRATVSAMNQKAFVLGLKNTNYINPIGLDDALQYSAAQDIFTLIKYIFENHYDIFRASRTYTADIFYKNLDNEKNKIKLNNTNILLSDYPRIIGSKTGLTDEAGQALAFLYRLKDGRAIAVIILKSSDRFGDGEKIIKWLDHN